ncbi:hypothetical protein GV828_09605 [Flavobacterium sp. NST-5]|uniref:Carboxypeptidase regulatory-like domain-containing protein n=1 Tax=Flavobacterium ichthyis TaxID=2698827 RepID=A0ABW9Z987_9FLAO|nr:carboxypeptidase-like regulatory domain-containing protein [Flavobacterium ichthyis]NBL65453.1 hypothetical protein [Flavobacterium ichthyis]
MKKIILLLIVLTLGCSNDDDNQRYCTEEFVFGLEVTVKNAETGANLQEGVTVVATDGNYSETLELAYYGLSTFLGAGERRGNYTLTVTKAGFQTYVSQPINVTADECHVITERVTVELQPE